MLFYSVLKFDLQVKNYNDLIFRKIEMNIRKIGSVPLILLLVVFPIENEKWLTIKSKEDVTTRQRVKDEGQKGQIYDKLAFTCMHWH